MGFNPKTPLFSHIHNSLSFNRLCRKTPLENTPKNPYYLSPRLNYLGWFPISQQRVDTRQLVGILSVFFDSFRIKLAHRDACGRRSVSLTAFLSCVESSSE